MTDFLINAYEWLVCLSEAIAVFLLFKSKFQCEKPRLYFALAAIPVLATCTFVMNLLNTPWVLLAVILIHLHFVYLLFCFEGALTMKCIWCPAPFLVFCISNYVCLIILYLITGIGELGMVSGNLTRVLLQLLYMALNYAMLIPLMRIKNDEGELPAVVRTVILVISMAGIFAAMYCFSQLVSPEASGHTGAAWIACVVVIALSAVLIILSWYLSRIYKKHLEAQKALQQAKLEAEHVRQVSAMYEHVRGWRHDIKGMVSTVTALAEQGEYESMKKYLYELNGAAEETRHLISTGNPAIDAAVTAKLMLADKCGADVEHSVSLPENVGIESTDVCSVIMNLMDNAIEAARALPEGERRIELELADRGGKLAVRVKNACSGNYVYKDGRLATTKQEGSGHGIGLERVARIVEAHRGFIKVEPGEHSFEVNILLPLEKSGI